MRLLTRQRPMRASRNEQPVGVRFIILEDGALAFEPPSPRCETPLEVAVLVQSHAESPQELVDRAIRRLESLERGDRAVVEAVIAAGIAEGPDVLDARESLAQAILEHMNRRGEGEIALGAGSDARPELRHELLCLAGALTGKVSSPSVCVRVLFGAQRPEREHRSGVYPALVAPDDEAPDSTALTG